MLGPFQTRRQHHYSLSNFQDSDAENDAEDKVDDYLKMKAASKDFDLLGWWKNGLGQFPYLSRVALFVHCQTHLLNEASCLLLSLGAV